MNELGYVMDGKLCIGGLINNKPDVVRRGGPIPADAYQKIVRGLRGYYRSSFRCAACQEPVLAFRAPSDMPAAIIQVCPCMLVAHLRPDQVPPYTTREEWAEFHALYAQEKLDPALPEYLQQDPFDGTAIGINPKGMRWVRRKLNLPDNVDLSPDGTVMKIRGGGSMHVDLARGVMSAYGDTVEDQEKLLETVLEVRTANGAGPMSAALYTIIVGDDPDYVWPLDADVTKVRPMPYRCPRCKARVKTAPIPGYLEVDRAYVCLRMAVILRREAPTPRSSIEWGDIRLRAESHTVRHKAIIAEANS